MSAKFLTRLSAVVTVLAVALYITGRALGVRLDREQTLGCLVFGAFHFILSLAFFLRGSVPYHALGASDAGIRRGFRFSLACVVFALFQIPIWSLMTRRFPPDGFTDGQSVVVIAGLLVSMFGSATPWIIFFFRYIRAANNRKRELSKQRKADREKP